MLHSICLIIGRCGKFCAGGVHLLIRCASHRGVLEGYARGLSDVTGFLESLGGTATPVDIATFGGMLPCWPHFPGAGHVRYRQFVPASAERSDGGLE